MLIETAIGDAYGIGFEYRPKEFVIKYNHLQQYYPHGRYTELHGKYSDDTQMSLAIAELMLEHDVWTDELIASKFVEIFKRDIRPGYSSRFYDFLMEINSGKEFIEKMIPKSERSGAAMRSGAIGLYLDEKTVLEKSAHQARITHDTPNGIVAAQAASLVVHYFRYHKGDKKYLGEYIDDILETNLNQTWKGPVGEEGISAVQSAITAIKRNDNMSDLLKDCIAYSGDVDTVAAIAMGAASMTDEIENNLPTWLYDDLENGTFGRDYIIALDMELLDKFSIK